ncbi:hypothetical protein F4802DRAFT_446789 [Xylaria palmicola]|nr:hypothetical protein F4802DRAFT_446789 [Xylaria palmicola]
MKISRGTIQAVIGQVVLPANHPGTPPAIGGVHHNPHLGSLAASSVITNQDRVLIYRTWGLLRDTKLSHGPSFAYNEYVKASSMLDGIGWLLVAPIVENGADVKTANSVPLSIEGIVVADEQVS